MPPPTIACTWVPADSYNYIDIYADKTRHRPESPGRVLENAKLVKQKKVTLDAKRKEKQKKRANHYDELCLQYTYAQQWLNKRNSQVSVKLTKSELKVFIKWFASRMALFQKADGIDVDKVSEDFVRHKIFYNITDAKQFLANVDLDGNGALSYDEFCEGLSIVNDYLQVMLLKKFIHSLKVKEHKHHIINMKKYHKFDHLVQDRGMKKSKDEDEEGNKIVPEKTKDPKKGPGDMPINTATVTKVILAGGGIMYTHSSNKKRVDVAAPTLPPASNKTTGKEKDTDGPSKLLKRVKSFRKSGSFGNAAGSKNSIRKLSVFVAPGNDAMLYQNALLKQSEFQSEIEIPDLTDVASPVRKTKNSEQDIAMIKDVMKEKLESFISLRQLSFEEKETLNAGDSIVLSEVFGDGSKGRSSPDIKFTPEKHSSSNHENASPQGNSRLRNKLMSAITRNNWM